MEDMQKSLEPTQDGDQDMVNQPSTGTAHTTTPGQRTPSGSSGPIPRKTKLPPVKRKKVNPTTSDNDQERELVSDDDDKSNHQEEVKDAGRQEEPPRPRSKKSSLPKGQPGDETIAPVYTKWVNVACELPHPPNNITSEEHVKSHAAKIFTNHKLHPESIFAYIQDGKTGFAVVGMPIGHKADWVDQLTTLMRSPANADTNNTTKFQLQREPWMAEDLKPIEITGTFPKPKDLPDAVPGEGALKRKHRLAKFVTQTGQWTTKGTDYNFQVEITIGRETIKMSILLFFNPARIGLAQVASSIGQSRVLSYAAPISLKMTQSLWGQFNPDAPCDGCISCRDGVCTGMRLDQQITVVANKPFKAGRDLHLIHYLKENDYQVQLAATKEYSPNWSPFISIHSEAQKEKEDFSEYLTTVPPEGRKNEDSPYLGMTHYDAILAWAEENKATVRILGSVSLCDICGIAGNHNTASHQHCCPGQTFPDTTLVGLSTESDFPPCPLAGTPGGCPNISVKESLTENTRSVAMWECTNPNSDGSPCGSWVLATTDICTAKRGTKATCSGKKDPDQPTFMGKLQPSKKAIAQATLKALQDPTACTQNHLQTIMGPDGMLRAQLGPDGMDVTPDPHPMAYGSVVELMKITPSSDPRALNNIPKDQSLGSLAFATSPTYSVDNHWEPMMSHTSAVSCNPLSIGTDGTFISDLLDLSDTSFYALFSNSVGTFPQWAMAALRKTHTANPSPWTTTEWNEFLIESGHKGTAIRRSIALALETKPELLEAGTLSADNKEMIPFIAAFLAQRPNHTLFIFLFHTTRRTVEILQFGAQQERAIVATAHCHAFPGQPDTWSILSLVGKSDIPILTTPPQEDLLAKVSFSYSKDSPMVSAILERLNPGTIEKERQYKTLRTQLGALESTFKGQQAQGPNPAHKPTVIPPPPSWASKLNQPTSTRPLPTGGPPLPQGTTLDPPHLPPLPKCTRLTTHPLTLHPPQPPTHCTPDPPPPPPLRRRER